MRERFFWEDSKELILERNAVFSAIFERVSFWDCSRRKDRESIFWRWCELESESCSIFLCWRLICRVWRRSVVLIGFEGEVGWEGENDVSLRSVLNVRRATLSGGKP
jgi:hypothetical protein